MSTYECQKREFHCRPLLSQHGLAQARYDWLVRCTPYRGAWFFALGPRALAKVRGAKYWVLLADTCACTEQESAHEQARDQPSRSKST